MRDSHGPIGGAGFRSAPGGTSVGYTTAYNRVVTNMQKYFTTKELENSNGGRSTKERNVTSVRAKVLLLLLAISITKIISRKFCKYFAILH